MTPRDEPSAEALALLDAAACGLMQTSADGTFLRANRTFCAWVGRPAESLIGHVRLTDLLSMGGRIFHQTHWAPLLQMQGSLSEVKLDLVHSDGSRIPMVLNAVRHEEHGVVVHELAALVARDRDGYERELVHSRKRLEALVAEAMRHQAEDRDRALFAEQMIGIVSHDLRNPLSSVTMAAALLGQNRVSAGDQRLLGKITNATARATALIADLLDFTQARLGAGLSVEREMIDVHASTAEAIDELAHIHPGRELAHERVGDGLCSADTHRLGQLIGNLVSNAMAYGASGAPVTVTSSVEPTTFSISVHNAGPPIPEASLAGLFKPMTRGITGRSSSRSVGLGLFIVQEIARAHGGEVRVVSTTEQGTTFRAVFPRDAPPST